MKRRLSIRTVFSCARIARTNVVTSYQSSYLLAKNRNYCITSNEPHVISQTKELEHVITLNNPLQRNILTVSVIEQLHSEFENVRQNPSIRAVILKAKGAVFSSGHNLKEMVGQPESYFQNLFSKLTTLIHTMHTLPVPIIAQVNGLAYAAGCQLALSSDIVYATEKASFAVPGIKYGLYCHTPGVALARSVSTKKAFQLLLTGDPLAAIEAEATGMINEVFEIESEMERKTTLMVKKISEMSRNVVALGKKGFYQQIDKSDIRDAYACAEQFMVENAIMKDAQHGFESFVQKKPPKWT